MSTTLRYSSLAGATAPATHPKEPKRNRPMPAVRRLNPVAAAPAPVAATVAAPAPAPSPVTYTPPTAPTPANPPQNIAPVYTPAPAAVVPSAPASGPTDLAVPMPAFLAVLPDALPTVEQRETGNYIAFAHPMSPSWPLQQQAGCKEGEPYIGGDGSVEKLDPFGFFLVRAYQFRAHIDKMGNTLGVTKDMTKEVDAQNRKLDEFYLCLVLVNVGGALIPAKFEAKGTKSGCVTNAIPVLERAGSPDWPSLSPAHALSAQFPHPFGRLYVTATTYPRTSKTSGNLYHAGRCLANPATVEQMHLLHSAMKDADFLSVFQQTAEAVATRLAELNALAK